LIISPTLRKPSNNGVFDSMSVSATILDELEIKPDPSFLGRSIFDVGKDAVVSEYAGRGNADLLKKDLYFTVTSQNYKLMAVLKNDKIYAERFYNMKEDPHELKNCIDSPGYVYEVRALLDVLFQERKALFSFRNLTKHDFVSPKRLNESTK